MEKARGNPTIGTSLIGPGGTSLAFPASIDPKDFFFGGTDKVTYTLIGWDWDGYRDENAPHNEVDQPHGLIDPKSVFNITVNTNDEMLTIVKRAATEGPHAAPDVEPGCAVEDSNRSPAQRRACDLAHGHHYGHGSEVVIEARDPETGLKADTRITVVRNGRPNTNHDGVELLSAIVGEQASFPTGADKKDPCNAFNVYCVDVTYDDPGTQNMDENWFWDAYADDEYLVYTAMRAAASAGYVSAVMGYNYNDYSPRRQGPAYLLMVTGLRAGVDATSGNPAPKQTKIEVIATDDGGLHTKAGEEAVLVVTVDPAPITKGMPVVGPATVTSAGLGLEVDVITDVTRFFVDNNDLVYSAKIKTVPIREVRYQFLVEVV